MAQGPPQPEDSSQSGGKPQGQPAQPGGKQGKYRRSHKRGKGTSVPPLKGKHKKRF